MNVPHNPVWHRVGREDGRIILKAEAKAPGRGVWLCQEPIEGGNGQMTLDRIANGGHVVKTLTCCCGQHRHNVLVLAASYL